MYSHYFTWSFEPDDQFGAKAFGKLFGMEDLKRLKRRRVGHTSYVRKTLEKVDELLEE